VNDTLTLDALEAIKTKQQATWASGDYSVIGTTLQLVGEQLCEAVDIVAGSSVLDVAAGNGNASLAAARRGAAVLATDYVGDLLEITRRRAEVEALPIEIRTADAEALPFDDGSFDAVLSTFGVMFTPNPERSSAELLRVCRSGGRIGLANWTPEGFIGGLFKIVGAHVPPPAGVPSPLGWGSEERLNELFADHGKVEVNRRHFRFRYQSARHFFETFVRYYGPTLKAWDALDDAGRQSFEAAILSHAEGANERTDGALTVPSEYLEVVVTKA
jgi:ubiquinone/menaquinone biosynthesis C-methylase UbiE